MPLWRANVSRVLHAINTRLDAAAIAFQLDHAEAKIVIVDREFMPVMQEVLTCHGKTVADK